MDKTREEHLYEYRKEYDALAQTLGRQMLAIPERKKAENAAKYINLVLHRLSAHCALNLFIQQSGTLSTKDIAETVQEFEALIAFQKSLLAHSHIDITHTELKENFDFWRPVDRELLYCFAIKSHYVAAVLHGVLCVSDRRWNIPLVEAFCTAAVLAQSFIDIEMLQTNDSAHYRNFGTVKKTAEFALYFYTAAADLCTKTQGYDPKGSQWYGRAIHFLAGAKSILRLLGRKDEIDVIDDRIAILTKRLTAEARTSGR